MARLLSAISILFGAAVCVHADGFCQCPHQDGSHCCVVECGITKDCTRLCTNAGLIATDINCNDGGKHSDVRTWNGGWRKGCRGGLQIGLETVWSQH